jgi:hypothetical protein
VDDVNNNPTRTWDGIPDRYTTTPTAAQWPNVVTVRVAVLMRSTTPTAGYDDSGKRYDLTSGIPPFFTCNPAVAGECQYRRHVFTQTFQVRNIAVRRAG